MTGRSAAKVERGLDVAPLDVEQVGEAAVVLSALEVPAGGERLQRGGWQTGWDWPGTG